MAPGQQAVKPGNATGHSGAPGQTGDNPGQAKKTADELGTSSSSSTSAHGLASMLQWLDQPVNSFPWYSSSGSSFYNQEVPDTTFSPFSEFYAASGIPVVNGIISTPAKFDIAQKTPATIYYGAGEALPYSQYVSTMPSRTNDLWVQGETSWSQYVVSPVGTWLQLVANVPVGGSAGFYESVQTDKTTQRYSTYQFNQGYNTMNFYAGQVGRHMLYFVVNNQPSNVIIVDVFAQAPSTQYQTYATTTTTPIVSTQPQTTPVGGDTPVTIQSQGMRGYQVFLDENYIGTDGSGGDALDGVFDFRVIGGQNHNIRVYDGQFNYPKSMYFARGVLKIINVEPGIAVYA
ncbi:MAG: hypothetical protein EHM14_04265 [Methanothrix sp.]|nr:MAG: hypothetical protein EHM14_04265 [Methanothrix sp.]